MAKNKLLLPNSTQIPNILLDFVFPRIPLAERACLEYICRRTYGFQKNEDRISYSQFIKGLKNKDGKTLNHGSGLSRASVNEALKNLVKAGAIFVRKNTKGNYYRINLEMDVRKVVQKINQFRKQTRISLKTRPKQVRLLNPQNKGNIGNKDVIIKTFKNEKRVIPTGEPPKPLTKQQIANLKKLKKMKAPLIRKTKMLDPLKRTRAQEESAGVIRPSGKRK